MSIKFRLPMYMYWYVCGIIHVHKTSAQLISSHVLKYREVFWKWILDWDWLWRREERQKGIIQSTENLLPGLSAAAPLGQGHLWCGRRWSNFSDMKIIFQVLCKRPRIFQVAILEVQCFWIILPQKFIKIGRDHLWSELIVVDNSTSYLKRDPGISSVFWFKRII